MELLFKLIESDRPVAVILVFIIFLVFYTVTGSLTDSLPRSVYLILRIGLVTAVVLVLHFLGVWN